MFDHVVTMKWPHLIMFWKWNSYWTHCQNMVKHVLVTFHGQNMLLVLTMNDHDQTCCGINMVIHVQTWTYSHQNMTMFDHVVTMKWTCLIMFWMWNSYWTHGQNVVKHVYFILSWSKLCSFLLTIVDLIRYFITDMVKFWLNMVVLNSVPWPYLTTFGQ